MSWKIGIDRVVWALLAGTGLVLSGCGQTNPESGPAESQAAKAPAAATNVAADGEGWWCPEHGVPEGICAQCDSKLAAEYQKKGDWCEEHNRPESQCFLCHPKLEEKFIAQYEAKFGHKPPKPTE